jgi:NAD(P)-dependent dehydrogenase (short-subunit alcohol dehydrogenase family)
MTPSGVALIVGAGDGLGGAIARRFARAGYHVCIARRGAEKLEPLRREIESAGGAVTAVGVDARKEDEVVALFDTIERDCGPIEVAVHNIGANVWFPIRETTVRKTPRSGSGPCRAFSSGARRRRMHAGRGTSLTAPGSAAAPLRVRSTALRALQAWRRAQPEDPCTWCDGP